MSLHRIEQRFGKGLGRKQFFAATIGMAAVVTLLVVQMFLLLLPNDVTEDSAAWDISGFIGVFVFLASFFPLLLFGTNEQKSRVLLVCLFTLVVAVPTVILTLTFTFDFN